jgi:ribose transport system permease protein
VTSSDREAGLRTQADSVEQHTNLEEVLQRIGLRGRGAGRSASRGDRADFLANYAVVLFFLALVVAFSLALPGRFPTSGNLQNILGDQAIPGLMALAAVLPLAAGEFDLSIAATLGFNSILVAWLTAHGVAVIPAALISVGVGALVGLVNALLVVGIGVNAFIATLGTSSVLAGLNLLVSNGETLFQGIPSSLLNVSQKTVGGLPLPVYYFAGAVLILWYLLERTPYGRYLRATGMGREPARLTGVPTRRMLASAFILAGAIAGFCGCLETARIGSATASVGPEFLLPAYAAAFLGATTIKRGRFNVLGTVVGVFTLAVGISGLTLWGAPFWVPDIFNGMALIVAVSFSVLVGRGGARV